MILVSGIFYRYFHEILSVLTYHFLFFLVFVFLDSDQNDVWWRVNDHGDIGLNNVPGPNDAMVDNSTADDYLDGSETEQSMKQLFSYLVLLIGPVLMV